MVVGKQGTSCLVYMDFNVGHVCIWSYSLLTLFIMVWQHLSQGLKFLYTVTGGISKVVHVTTSCVNLGG